MPVSSATSLTAVVLRSSPASWWPLGMTQSSPPPRFRWLISATLLGSEELITRPPAETSISVLGRVCVISQLYLGTALGLWQAMSHARGSYRSSQPRREHPKPPV